MLHCSRMEDDGDIFQGVGELIEVSDIANDGANSGRVKFGIRAQLMMFLLISGKNEDLFGVRFRE